MVKNILGIFLFTTILTGCYKTYECPGYIDIRVASSDSAWLVKAIPNNKFTLKSNANLLQTITNSAHYFSTAYTPDFRIENERCKKYFATNKSGSCATSIYNFNISYGTNFNPFLKTHALTINWNEGWSWEQNASNIGMDLYNNNLIYYNNAFVKGKLYKERFDTAEYFNLYTNPNGLEFKRVYHFKFAIADTLIAAHIPKEVFFCKEIGVIGYTTSNNSSWHITD